MALLFQYVELLQDQNSEFMPKCVNENNVVFL